MNEYLPGTLNSKLLYRPNDREDTRYNFMSLPGETQQAGKIFIRLKCGNGKPAPNFTE
jgi:hypothetical protein